MKSFQNGSAPGPSGLRANHLKEAAFCPSPDRAIYGLWSLSGVVNLMCAGKVPQAVVPYLCGVTLLASKKRDGGLRPIAVGEVLHCLSSKCISKAVRSEALEVLTPLQVGVGVQAGCESIVHPYPWYKKIATFYQSSNGLFSSISQTHSITLEGSQCFKR